MSETTCVHDVATALNSELPVRIALLGGPKAGKSSVVSKLTLGQYRDTYYPTHLVMPILFSYSPATPLARAILDEHDTKHSLAFLSAVSAVCLSPVIYQAYSKTLKQDKHGPSAKNDVYQTFLHESATYVPPQVSPMLVELVDTPAYNPTMVVPFLEASLYRKLDRDVLHRLADEPRRPVLTNPLLVASGASEMNGAIDGYFFVYSAVPTSSPPAYDSAVAELTELLQESTLTLLPSIKETLDEAWREYNLFRTRWELGKESDIFSLKTALKNMFRDSSLAGTDAQRRTARSWLHNRQLPANPQDPADPNCPPPMWILCTHANSPLVSPTLVETGKKLAKSWKCGFAAIDCDEEVDAALALMIREIVERRKLRRKRK